MILWFWVSVCHFIKGWSNWTPLTVPIILDHWKLPHLEMKPGIVIYIMSASQGSRGALICYQMVKKKHPFTLCKGPNVAIIWLLAQLLAIFWVSYGPGARPQYAVLLYPINRYLPTVCCAIIQYFTLLAHGMLCYYTLLYVNCPWYAVLLYLLYVKAVVWAMTLLANYGGQPPITFSQDYTHLHYRNTEQIVLYKLFKLIS